MIVTVDQIKRVMPQSGPFAAKYVEHLNQTMEEAEIVTPVRVAAYLAQIAVESAQLNRVSENLNYSAKGLLKTFPTRFTPEDAARYAHKPEAIANKVYGGRYGNGPESSGDGWKYRGRGLKQITFLDNYRWLSGIMFGDEDMLVQSPEILLEPYHAARSAAQFWLHKGCNELADAGTFTALTKRINGGLNGQADRVAFWGAAKPVFGVVV